MKDKFQSLLEEGVILGLPEEECILNKKQQETLLDSLNNCYSDIPIIYNVQGLVDTTMSEERITEIQNQIDETIKQYYERKAN